MNNTDYQHLLNLSFVMLNYITKLNDAVMLKLFYWGQKVFCPYFGWC